MPVIRINNQIDFEEWRNAARQLALRRIDPCDVAWLVDGDQQQLFDASPAPLPAGTDERFSVPRAFVDLAEVAMLHRDPARFDLLYRLLWRLRLNPQLLAIATDVDVARAEALVKAVRRDVHKMHAFVRFREIKHEQKSRFVAWFEPSHHIVEAAAAFFVDRFASMNWSILTPDRCAHWSESHLSFTEGVSQREAPSEDRVEDVWRSYYASIFNPARLKTKAMQAEMPKKYWRNLPEASLIKPLTEMAERTTRSMIRSEPGAPKIRPQRKAAFGETPRPGGGLDELRAKADNCRACPLWKDATQTVFGEGPATASIMFVGEQPGDMEDLAGKPFVGPAGQVFDRALKDAGIERDNVYVTNAVKHFKFMPRGKRRIHQRPNSSEIRTCREWYEGELAALKPSLVVALGATAAQSVVGKIAAVGKVRGRILDGADGVKALVTVHPSYLLRLPDKDAKQQEYDRFVDDLKIAAAMLKVSKAA